MTANIHAILFDDYHGADNMLTNVNTWQENGWITVEDAVIATRGAGSDEPPLIVAAGSTEQPKLIAGQSAPGMQDVEIKQTNKQGGKFTLGGGGIGLLAGLLFGGPIGGLVIGATAGAIAGALKDYGIDDNFIREVSEGLQPGNSILFLMTSGGDEEKILAELRPHRATLLKTTLPPEREAALRAVLRKSE